MSNIPPFDFSRYSNPFDNRIEELSSEISDHPVPQVALYVERVQQANGLASYTIKPILASSLLGNWLQRHSAFFHWLYTAITKIRLSLRGDSVHLLQTRAPGETPRSFECLKAGLINELLASEEHHLRHLAISVLGSLFIESASGVPVEQIQGHVLPALGEYVQEASLSSWNDHRLTGVLCFLMEAPISSETSRRLATAILERMHLAMGEERTCVHFWYAAARHVLGENIGALSALAQRTFLDQAVYFGSARPSTIRFFTENHDRAGMHQEMQALLQRNPHMDTRALNCVLNSVIAVHLQGESNEVTESLLEMLRYCRDERPAGFAAFIRDMRPARMNAKPAELVSFITVEKLRAGELRLPDWERLLTHMLNHEESTLSADDFQSILSVLEGREGVYNETLVLRLIEILSQHPFEEADSLLQRIHQFVQQRWSNYIPANESLRSNVLATTRLADQLWPRIALEILRRGCSPATRAEVLTQFGVRLENHQTFWSQEDLGAALEYIVTNHGLRTVELFTNWVRRVKTREQISVSEPLLVRANEMVRSTEIPATLRSRLVLTLLEEKGFLFDRDTGLESLLVLLRNNPDHLSVQNIFEIAAYLVRSTDAAQAEALDALYEAMQQTGTYFPEIEERIAERIIQTPTTRYPEILLRIAINRTEPGSSDHCNLLFRSLANASSEEAEYQSANELDRFLINLREQQLGMHPNVYSDTLSGFIDCFFHTILEKPDGRAWRMLFSQLFGALVTTEHAEHRELLLQQLTDRTRENLPFLIQNQLACVSDLFVHIRPIGNTSDRMLQLSNTIRDEILNYVFQTDDAQQRNTFLGSFDEEEREELVSNYYWSHSNYLAVTAPETHAATYRIRIRQRDLERHPEQFLSRFAQQCYQEKPLAQHIGVDFLTDTLNRGAGIDGGGLRREFMTSFFQSLREQALSRESSLDLLQFTSGSSGLLPRTERRLDEIHAPILSQQEALLYEAIGKLMGLCGAENSNLCTGPVFQPQVFAMICAVDRQYLGMTFEELPMDQLVNLYKASLDEDSSHSRTLVRYYETQELDTNILGYAYQDPDDIPESLQRDSSPENLRRHSDEIFAALNQTVRELARNKDGVAAAFHMAKGMQSHFTDWPNASAMQTRIQGEFSKELVRNAVADAPDSIRAHLLRWIDESNTRDVQRLVQAITGSPMLATNTRFAFMTWRYLDPRAPIAFATCSRQMRVAGSYPSYEEFKQILEFSVREALADGETFQRS